MKDKEKQIEEMGKDVCNNINTKMCADGTCPKHWDCPYSNTMAEILIEKGYQKVGKDQVVVLKTEYERLIYVEGELQEMNADYYNELNELKDNLKDSVVLSREEQDKLYQKGFNDGKEFAEKFYKPLVKAETSKETAREILNKVKLSLEDCSMFENVDLEQLEFDGATIKEILNEIAKQCGVVIDSN